MFAELRKSANDHFDGGVESMKFSRAAMICRVWRGYLSCIFDIHTVTEKGQALELPRCRNSEKNIDENIGDVVD